MRKTTKLLASLLVVCMLVACLPMSALFASAETMTAEPTQNSTPGANWIANNDAILTPSVVTAASAAAFTSKANGYTFDLTETGYTAIGGTANTEYAVNVLKNSFAATDTWSLEFDLNAGAAYTGKNDYRVVLNLGDITTSDGKKNANGFRIMLQGNTLYVTKTQGTTSYTWQSVGSIGMTVPNGGTLHFSYVVKEYKVIDITISNGTKTFTYSWNIADSWGANFTVSTLSNFTLSHKNIYIDISNLECNKTKTGVTPPTAENNLVLTNGKWVSGYSGKVYPFVGSEDSFYINTTVAGQVASGSTAYTTSFDVCPFNTNNAGYTFDATKSYVISANVARANSTNQHPDTGSTVVSRLFYYFGKYNDRDLMIYFDKNGYHWAKEGYKTYTTSPLLSNVPLNEYARITAYVSPFEIEIYVNGEFLTSMALEDPSLLTYDFKFRSAGTEAWFKDVAIWENTANGDEYYDVLSKDYNYYTAPGVRTDLDLTAIKAALDAYTAGSANTTLTPFVKTFVGASNTVVNNYVADGSIAPYGNNAASFFTGYKSYGMDANVNGGLYTMYSLYMFANGTAPMVAGKDYVLEADVDISDYMGTTNVRLGFELGVYTETNKPIRFILQDNGTHQTNNVDAWIAQGSMSNGLNVKNCPKFHLRVVFSNTGYTIKATSLDGSVTYLDKSINLADFSFDTTKITLAPAFVIRTAKLEVSNIYIGESVEASKDALSATVTEYAAKDTEGFTADSVKNFTDALAAANTVLADYEHYSNAEINAAAAAVVSAFGALEEATVDVVIGGEPVVIDPNNLPVNERPEGSTKHILGWKNPDGSAYAGTTYVEGLIPDYVETKMMDVKFQLGTNGNSIRYIASVDTLERYNSVGWVFSVSDTTPEIGEAGVAQRSSTRVYEALIADGETVTTEDIYGAVDYSKYLYVFEITEIPEANFGTEIYVRPYVEMEDGTIVYGDVEARSVNSLSAQ